MSLLQKCYASCQGIHSRGRQSYGSLQCYVCRVIVYRLVPQAPVTTEACLWGHLAQKRRRERRVLLTREYREGVRRRLSWKQALAVKAVWYRLWLADKFFLYYLSCPHPQRFTLRVRQIIWWFIYRPRLLQFYFHLSWTWDTLRRIWWGVYEGCGGGYLIGRMWARLWRQTIHQSWRYGPYAYRSLKPLLAAWGRDVWYGVRVGLQWALKGIALVRGWGRWLWGLRRWLFLIRRRHIGYAGVLCMGWVLGFGLPPYIQTYIRIFTVCVVCFLWLGERRGGGTFILRWCSIVLHWGQMCMFFFCIVVGAVWIDSYFPPVEGHLEAGWVGTLGTLYRMGLWGQALIERACQATVYRVVRGCVYAVWCPGRYLVPSVWAQIRQIHMFIQQTFGTGCGEGLMAQYEFYWRWSLLIY